MEHGKTLVVTLADGRVVKATSGLHLLLDVYKRDSQMFLFDVITRVLPTLTTDIILGMDFLHNYNPNIDWSQKTQSFELDWGIVAVDASKVPGSICAMVVFTQAWLGKLHADPESDSFLVVVHQCDGLKEGETAVDS